MIKPEIRQQIQTALAEIATQESVRILHACESGSRAWGFASPDSDYDVRFIYAHPRDWYLSIDEKRDVIERPLVNDLDINGWDLRKALRLMRKSNPPLLEWLMSPIVYAGEGAVRDGLRELLPHYYSPVACFHHYISMARGNFREYLRGEEVWTKKYFYVLRPVLACQWIEQDRGLVPVEFEVLMRELQLPNDVVSEIDLLLEKKKDGAELRTGPKSVVINEYLEREIERLGKLHPNPPEKRDSDEMDALFRKVID